jgi:hypothetical protein
MDVGPRGLPGLPATRCVPEGVPGDPPSELRLLQSLTIHRRPQDCCSICDASHEVCRPSSARRTAGPLETLALHARVRSTFRLSQPPGGLLPATPSGLVSCRWRSWGSPFRAFPSQRSRSASRRPLPSCRRPRSAHPPCVLARPIAAAFARRCDVSNPAARRRVERGSAPGSGTSWESVCRGSSFRSHLGLDALLGFHSLQGLTPSRPRVAASSLPPPMSFSAPAWPRPRTDVD